jgi:hypothetical protein
MRDIRMGNTVLVWETKGKRPLEIVKGKQDNINIKTIKMLCWDVN